MFTRADRLLLWTQTNALIRLGITLDRFRKETTMTQDEFRTILQTVATDLAAEGQKLSDLVAAIGTRTDVPQDIVDAVIALDSGIKDHTATITGLAGTPPTP